MLSCNHERLSGFSNSETVADGEHEVRLGRGFSHWMGQLVVVGIVVGGAVLIGMAALPPGEVDSSGPIRAQGGPAAQVIESVAFSPDGKILATCGCDNSVSLWDVSRLGDSPSSQPFPLPHKSIRYAVAFSPDGNFIGTAGRDSVAIWSSKSGQYTAILEEETEACRCLAFSPDGRTLALGMEDGAIRLWDMPGCHERAVVTAHKSVVRSLAFSADGRQLVSSGQDTTIMLIDAINGAPIRSLEGGRSGFNPVLIVAFSPDGHTVAVGEVGGEPHDVTLLDAESGKVVASLTGHQTGVHALAFSPDGGTLATAAIDSCIKLWDVTEGKELATFQSGVSLVKSIAFSSDGAWLAFGAGKDDVKIWEVGRSRSFVLSRFHGQGATTTTMRPEETPLTPASVALASPPSPMRARTDSYLRSESLGRFPLNKRAGRG
jgi:WD40 repeat protein